MKIKQQAFISNHAKKHKKLIILQNMKPKMI